LSARHVELARQAGALSVLPIALRGRFGVELIAGHLEAATMFHGIEAVTQVTGGEPVRYGAVILAPWRGASNDVTSLVQQCRRDIERRGEGGGLTRIEWALTVLYNGRPVRGGGCHRRTDQRPSRRGRFGGLGLT
jgi:hypothetical protein